MSPVALSRADATDLVDTVSSSISPPPPSSVSYEGATVTARALPDELVQQITIYFEEELYYQGIAFLSNLLAVGRNPKGSIFVPPPEITSFISTLSLHPRLTIHALTNEKLRVAAAATTYLSALLAITGPVTGGFAQAYAFSNHAYMRGGRRKAVHRHSDSSDESKADLIESELAQAQGFFNRADDFWAAVGWAFSCSTSHLRRWETWSLWLSHVIDLLEQDWRMRENRDSSRDDRWARKTLLAQYTGDGSGTRVKRIVRAIFADGSGPEFTEIWKDETQRKRRKAPTMEKAVKLDIEAGQLGDYGDQSSDDDEDIPSDEEEGTEMSPTTLGDPEALSYRARLLALLSLLSLADPEYFTQLATLYTTLLSHLRPLPLQTFYTFLNPRSLSHFSSEAASGLIQYLARSFLEPAAPACSMDELDWSTIEKHYAPWASSGQTGASTVGENGKLAVCIELLINLARVRLGFSPLRGISIQPAVDRKANEAHRLWIRIEKGCTRRRDRAGTNAKRAKKGEAGSEFDFEEARDFEIMFLDGARTRLALLLGMKI